MTEGSAPREQDPDDNPSVGGRATPVAVDPPQREGLTPLRRAVLETLLNAERPLGAYDIIDKVEGAKGQRLMPPSVYRILAFLCDQKLVARIETTNAYLASVQPIPLQPGMYFLCEQCGSARWIESPKLGDMIDRQAAALGFRIGKRIVEMQGVCEQCQTSSCGREATGTE